VPSVICTRNRTLRVGWRLTAEFSGRGLTCQHAGARRSPERRHLSPAAKHFMFHGPLQRFVRRQLRGAHLLFIPVLSHLVTFSSLPL
jgi:hypothetical protein